MASASTQETTATGNWAKAGVPHRGWRCVDIDELDEQTHLCEMCEARYVRFVHVMQNDRYDGELRVGCICAGHMEEDFEGAKRREATFKAGRSRRNRWLARKWRTSALGNAFLNTNDGFNVVVFPRMDVWGARVEHRKTGDTRLLPFYSNSDAAKLAAFDVMLKMVHTPTL